MVKSEHKKRGVGMKLLEKMEKDLKKEGMRKVFLVVFRKK
jgi:N-acetylglutamate synthase-like GNAT family acetyltransferase